MYRTNPWQNVLPYHPGPSLHVFYEPLYVLKKNLLTCLNNYTIKIVEACIRADECIYTVLGFKFVWEKGIERHGLVKIHPGIGPPDRLFTISYR